MRPMSLSPNNPATIAPAAYSHFTAFNALVDAGWLKALKGVELTVLLVYLRHADADGVSFPGPTRIAKAIGHAKINHVCAARRKLEAMGLLVRLPGGGGDLLRYRVVTPGQSRNGASPSEGLVPERDYHQSPGGTTGSPKSGPGIVPERDSEQHIEEPREQHSEQPMPPEPPKGGAGERHPGQQPRGHGTGARKRGGDHVTAVAMDDLPEELRAPEMVSALNDWIAYKAERKPRVTQVSLRTAIRKLSTVGVARGVQLIETAITNNWQGFWFDDKPTTQRSNGHANHQRQHQPVERGRHEYLPL